MQETAGLQDKTYDLHLPQPACACFTYLQALSEGEACACSQKARSACKRQMPLHLNMMGTRACFAFSYVQCFHSDTGVLHNPTSPGCKRQGTRVNLIPQYLAFPGLLRLLCQLADLGIGLSVEVMPALEREALSEQPWSFVCGHQGCFYEKGPRAAHGIC